MEFFIKKNATLPLLKLQIVKDGRNDFDSFMKTIELSAIFFSMVDIETGIPKITSRPAGFVEKTFIEPNAEPEYYIYYQFQNRDTNRVGRYEGQFMLRNSDGVLILPIREKLFINVQESFIADDLPYDSCYVSEFPCCVNGPYTTTTTTVPCPSCPTCPEPTPTPVTTTTTTIPQTTLTPTPTPTQTLPPFNDLNFLLIPGGDLEYELLDGITITLESIITPGSINIDYILSSNQILSSGLTMNFTHILGLVSGGTLNIPIEVTINPEETSGTSSFFTSSYNFEDLNGSSNFTNISFNPSGYSITVTNEDTSFVGPTPTPTPTITPSETPTPTPTQSGVVLNNYMMTRCFGLGIESGVMTIPNQSFSYKTSDGKCWAPISPSLDPPVLTYIDSYLDCTACINSNPTPTPTPTMTETPTPTPTNTPTPTPLPNPTFLSTWNTLLGNGNPTITLPLTDTGIYNFTVNWGDGNTDTITSYNQPEVTHTYSTGGVKTIIINGIIDGWSFSYNGVDSQKLTTINNFGTLKLSNDYPGGFLSCINLTNIGGIFDLSGITNMSFMFAGCNSLTSINGIESWDVSNVTNMQSMFNNANLFNQNINSWDVSNVTNMQSMFIGADIFNQPLSGWNVSNVTNMQSMFANTQFNQNINNWNVSGVTDMSFMFFGLNSFNQPLNGWNVSNVTNMGRIFFNTYSFNQDISSWDVSSVTNMDGLFAGAISFNQDISGWNVQNVGNMDFMFQTATSFNQDLSSWCVPLIPSTPTSFDSGASAWSLPRPDWGVAC